MIAELLWVVYDFYCGSYIGILAGLLLLTSEILVFTNERKL